MKKRVFTFIIIAVALCCIIVAIVVPSVLSAQYKKSDSRLSSIINSEVVYKFNYKTISNDSPQLKKLSTKIVLHDAQLNEISTVKLNNEEFVVDVDATGILETNKNGSEAYSLSYKEFNIKGKKIFKQSLACTYIPYANFLAIDGNKNDFHYKNESVYTNSTKYEAITIWISSQATNWRSYSLTYNLISFENGLIIHYSLPPLSFVCEDPELIDKIDLICQEKPTLNGLSQ